MLGYIIFLRFTKSDVSAFKKLRLFGTIALRNEGEQMTLQDDLLTKEAVLIDVRSPQEFSEKHAILATNIPIDQIEAGQLDLPKDKTIYLHCQLGPRADRAEQALKAQGYESVHNLKTLEAVEQLGLQFRLR